MPCSQPLRPFHFLIHLRLISIICFALIVHACGYGQSAIGKGYNFQGNGKNYNAVVLKSLYTPATLPWDSVSNFIPSKEASLTDQQRHLNNRSNSAINYGNLTISQHQFIEVIETLKLSSQMSSKELNAKIVAYKIKGEDGKGNVHFTGYYSPIVKVRATRDSVYKYPFYRLPKKWEGPMPSRRQIDAGHQLQGLNLEIAWASDLLEVYFMHIQGSGYIMYPDGKKQLLRYGGKNSHGYKSIGKHLVETGEIPANEISLDAIVGWCEKYPKKVHKTLYSNPSYTFFEPVNKPVTGAANIPLIESHSVAVDTRYVPLGAVMVGKTPILNSVNELVKYEWKILFAHDTGAAIKGAGHVDIYTGIGVSAKTKASALHHYGELYLLLPK